MQSDLCFLDLFAGAGGLSEGFIRAGFKPIAHVEYDEAACYTLRTRTAFHWLRQEGMLEKYHQYLRGELTRPELYQLVPQPLIDSVIHETISETTMPGICTKIDNMLQGRKLDLIIGGPPCQAYSVIGRARGNMAGDSRNHLFQQYAKFLAYYQPQYFVFENVVGLLSAKDEHGQPYFDKMRQAFKDVGYATEWQVLSANDYGVLQNRKRIILVGKRDLSAKDFYPDLQKWHPETNIFDLLSDLPKIHAGQGDVRPCNMMPYQGQWLYQAGIKQKDGLVTWHQARPHTAQDLEIYRIAVERWNNTKTRLQYNDLPQRLRSHKDSQSFTDRFKVVAGDLPYAHTVVAHICKDGHHYIHPDIDQNRSLTPREAARIQSFPDDYFFEGSSLKPSRTSAFKQIGNAVPVVLAQKIAEKISRSWQ